MNRVTAGLGPDHGEWRAGGTDLQQRLRAGVSPGPPVDLAATPGMDVIEWDGGGVRIGALVPMASVAASPGIRAAYPGLAQAAGALATPQIRAIGTIGGNLLQHSRCWYYRDPGTTCLKKGGDSCPAREGNHRYGVCFDVGPCVFPHPSTLGMVLLAYEAAVDTTESPRSVPVEDLYGDGSDGRDHQLARGGIVTAVRLRPPVPDERAVYFRSISRARAEWPLVETVVRLKLDSGRVALARVAVGGVAPVPLRLPAVEEILHDQMIDDSLIDRASAAAAERANPLPMTRYKVRLLQGTVKHALCEAASAGAAANA